MMQNKKAQGSLEYLLLIGGAVLVAVIVITLILGITSTGQTQTLKSSNTGLCLIDKQKCLTAGGTVVSCDLVYNNCITGLSPPGGGGAQTCSSPSSCTNPPECKSATGATCSGNPLVCGYPNNAPNGTTCTSVAGGTCQNGTCVNTLTQGLVGYWQFNGNANDSSGNGHNGTLVSSPTFPIDPQRGQVLSLDGNQYVSIPDSPELDFGTSDFTITMWVKTSTLQQSTIAKAYHNSSPGYGLYRGTFYLTSADGTNSPNFLRVASPGPDDGSNPPNAEAWRTGTWHNIAITITRSPAPWGYFYVDGTLKVAWRDVNATKATGISNASPLLIGAGYVSTPPPTVSIPYRYNGQMDNIRIYSRALSVAEIRQVCAQEKHALFAAPNCT